MQLRVIQRILGLLLMVFSVTMLPPVLVGLIYGDGAIGAFLAGFLVTFVAGFLLWLPVRRFVRDLHLRDGFIIVVMFWSVLALFGSLPFMLGPGLNMSFIDALFESMSGLTTTGATVIVGIDSLPKALLFYRQELQWLGGMGIIVLAVAILPMFGIGGMQLYRAETPGPMKDNKLTPRITETAKALWYIYLGLTVSCALAYWAAGMSGFDAISHSFSTVAIGGFSTHDASIGYFNSAAIEGVAIIFMLLAGVNFALHFVAVRNMRVSAYWADAEFRAYLSVLLIVAVIACSYLYFNHTFDSVGSTIHHGLFQVISIGTTAGFTTADYHTWPGFLPALLLLLSFVGGCAGSTGGGMKVIRVLLLIKQGSREILRLIHPNAEIPVKVGGVSLSPRVMQSVWGFFAFYVMAFCFMSLMLAATGLDLVSAFSAVAACMNNLGPGLGEVGSNYASVSPIGKGILCFAMLLGRLEIFTLLVLLTPAFWRA